MPATKQRAKKIHLEATATVRYDARNPAPCAMPSPLEIGCTRSMQVISRKAPASIAVALQGTTGTQLMMPCFAVRLST
jgi:hypothetical protein